jgi:hypothetical protein
MHLNKALFSDNGNCGYVLKPKILRDPNSLFNPEDINTMKRKAYLKVKIISGQHLPQNKDIVKDVSDPYVVINIYGVKFDIKEKKTRHIENNGNHLNNLN